MHYIFVLLATVFVQASLSQVVFHGTSILMQPNELVPANSTFESASFYCFATLTGYVSFGWWMGGDPSSIDLEPVTPSPRLKDVHWVEYSEGKCDSRGICDLKAYNFNVSNPETPAFVEDYVILPFRLGEDDHQLMHLSYFDRERGKIAVGVRDVLGGKECRRALETLDTVVKTHSFPIKFDLNHTCSEEGSQGLSQGRIKNAQQTLSRFLRSGLTWQA